jgi:primosomal protein N' (replication factor Y)
MPYVDVILPLALGNTYTYSLPDHFADVQRGQRLVVQFGAKKLYTALAYQIHDKAPEKYRAKEVLAVLDEYPIVTEKQLAFWEWIANYYCSTLGEVMNLALPSGLKLSSESRIVLGEERVAPEDLSEKEYLVLEALQQQDGLSLSEVSEVLGQKTIFPVIRALLDRDAIVLQEELNDRYKPKVIRTVVLHLDQEGLAEHLERLQKAPKQLELLLSYLKIKKEEPTKLIDTAFLVKSVGASYQALNALVEKGIFRIEEEVIGRIENYEEPVLAIKELSTAQEAAYQNINEQFQEKDTVLLHGVTSSGKTEIYVKLMQEAIARGEQVLYLLPEIALTTQIINRLRKYFGHQIGVYHSKFNQHERVEIWNDVLEGQRYPIILGARSSLFLPFDNLGLIIIDEEHENTFKQYQTGARYHARDAAMVWAKQQAAKVLLGSATPAIESYTNAQTGKYGYVALSERYGGVQMPSIETIDIKYVRHRKQMQGAFSPYLLEQIKDALDKKEQVILFQNRRGFAPVSECHSCGWTAKCHSCDVSLTYHKKISLLKCHYCGYSETPVRKCKACGSLEVQVKGFGTEKIEEELQPFFPEASIYRMDLDTTSQKNAHQEIIDDFENKRIDILIGTQMVTKGLDFDNVSLVGILNADSMLNFPDFRSHERSFQLMAQVAGRAGRKQKQGRVLIQSYSPDHPVIEAVKTNDYLGMYRAEMQERKDFLYPPYCKLIKITVKHKDYLVTNQAARELAILMRKAFGKQVLGPEYPSVARIKNNYLKNILLKLSAEMSAKQAKQHLSKLIEQVNQMPDFRRVRFVVDVDPV